jgi:transposase
VRSPTWPERPAVGRLRRSEDQIYIDIIMIITNILTDKQFAYIEPLLREGLDQRGRKPTISDRDALEGALYILREGCRWRALPKHFGPWTRVFMRYKRWSDRGVWWKVLMRLQRAGIIEVDITFRKSSGGRAHRHAAGAREWTASDL